MRWQVKRRRRLSLIKGIIGRILLIPAFLYGGLPKATRILHKNMISLAKDEKELQEIRRIVATTSLSFMLHSILIDVYGMPEKQAEKLLREMLDYIFNKINSVNSKGAIVPNYIG